MTLTSKAIALGVCLAVSLGCAISSTAIAKPSDLPPGIAWELPVNGSLQAALEKAKTSKKPVFVYWGAVWCPPCNQLKGKVFTHPDFVRLSRSVVPLYIDGDAPGAQKLGTELKLRAYPTTLLLRADGQEITRFPAEVEPSKYLSLLTTAIAQNQSVRDLVKSALAQPKTKANELKAADWQLLSLYSWDLDDQEVVAPKQRAATLQKLALLAPSQSAAEIVSRNRLAFKALAFMADNKETPDSVLLNWLNQALDDPKQVAQYTDIWLYSSKDLLKIFADAKDPTKTQAGQTLKNKITAYLTQLSDNSQQAWSDRIAALYTLHDIDPDLAKNESSQAKATKAKAQQIINAALAATSGVGERQALVPSAAAVLTKLGLIAESDRLLKAELPRALAPYYHMASLAANAKQDGRHEEALRWSQQAFEAAQGPATKIQWGASYIRLLVELSPRDSTRIEAAASKLIAGLEPVPETFYARNRRSLERVSTQLHAWNKDGEHGATLMRLQADLSRVCRKLPAGDAGRFACEGALAPPRDATSKS